MNLNIMQEIKFRFWDKQKKEFRYDLYLSNEGVFEIYNDYGGTFSSGLRKDNLASRIIVQQFTGILDSHGVEIYEGDIVEYTQHMFNTNKTTVKTKEIKWIQHDGQFNVYETEAGQSDHKVIGNIFDDQQKSKANHTANAALDEKLNAIRHCASEGWDEDLQEHLFDLLRSLQIKNKLDADLTTEGLKLKSYLRRNKNESENKN